MALARVAAIAAFAIVGWIVCAATIGIGFAVMTERGALILHAIVAPIAFAGLSWLYFTRFFDDHTCSFADSLPTLRCAAEIAHRLIDLSFCQVTTQRSPSKSRYV